MSIVVQCSGCGKRLALKDELAGRRIQCRCGQVFVVPRPARAAEPEDGGFALAPAQPADPLSSLLDDGALPTAQKLPAAKPSSKAKEASAAPQPTRRKPKVKVDRQVLTNMILGAVLIVGAAIGAFVVVRMTVTGLTPGYATPEDAFAAYQKALYDENWRKMMSTLDTESQALLAGRAAWTAWMAVKSETVTNLALVLHEQGVPEPDPADLSGESLLAMSRQESSPGSQDAEKKAPKEKGDGAANGDAAGDAEEGAKVATEGETKGKTESKAADEMGGETEGAAEGDAGDDAKGAAKDAAKDEAKGGAKGDAKADAKGDAKADSEAEDRAAEYLEKSRKEAQEMERRVDERSTKLVAGVPDKVGLYVAIMDGIAAYKERHASGNALLRVFDQRADLSVLETCSRAQLSKPKIQGDTATATATYKLGKRKFKASVMFKMTDGRWFLHIPRPGEASGESFADVFRMDMLLPR